MREKATKNKIEKIVKEGREKEAKIKGKTVYEEHRWMREREREREREKEREE